MPVSFDIQADWIWLESRSGGCTIATNMAGELKECYFNKYRVYAHLLNIGNCSSLFMRTAFGEANF